MPDNTKTTETTWWPLCTAAPVLVYFLFPHLYLLPFKGRPQAISAVAHIFFAPVIFLVDNFPPYKALLRKECEWLGIS